MSAEAAPKVWRWQWDPQSTKADINAVEGGEKVASAAKHFQVPRKTLDDWVKGQVKHGTNPGPNTALTADEESALANYFLYMAEHGFPLTMKMALSWAIAI